MAWCGEAALHIMIHIESVTITFLNYQIVYLLWLVLFRLHVSITLINDLIFITRLILNCIT